MTVQPQIPVFVGGQMTDLPSFPGTVLAGTELFEIVSPGDPQTSLNYSVTSAILASLIIGIVAQPVIITSGATIGAPYVPTIGPVRFLFDKTVGSASYVTLLAAASYPTGILIRDIKGDADVNPITVTFSSGQTCDGLSTVTISTPYGGYWFNPLQTLGAWYLGSS